MSERFSSADFNSQIYEEASGWFVEMRSGDVDAQGRQRFDAWVRKSPEHLRAYLEISEVWDDASLVDKGRTGDTSALVASAKAGAEVISLPEASARRQAGASLEASASQAAPALPLASASQATSALPSLVGSASLSPAAAVPPTSSPTQITPRRAPTPRFASLAAAASIAVCGIAAFFAYQHYKVPMYSTGIGEQRIVTLADGSRVELNSSTRLSVAFTDSERRVELLSGQALFSVTKNAQRPFTVQSGDIAVRVVGTAFDVHRTQDKTTVTVVEGRVAVRAMQADVPMEPILVEAGEQLTAPVIQIATKPLQANRVNVESATAWTRGSLVFEGSTLADVVDEFNRHNEQQLIVLDPALSAMRISGVYDSTDPDLLVRFLREQPNVQIDESAAKIVITSK